MRVYQIIPVILLMLLMNGCGDQFWCGDDGCEGKKPDMSKYVHRR